MKKKRVPAKAQCVTNYSKTSQTPKNKRGRPTLKTLEDSDNLHYSLKELSSEKNGSFTKSASNEKATEALSPLDYKSLMAQCVDVCEHLERACSGEEVITENDSNHTLSVAPGAISSTLAASDLQQPTGNCSPNGINKSTSTNTNFIDSRKRPPKKPSLFRSSSASKKQRIETTIAGDKPLMNYLKPPAKEEADYHSLLAADSIGKAGDSNGQSEETNSSKFSSNGGPVEIPFIMVKSSFESRYRQYKCVFCSKLLDKLSQYEDHWLSHINAESSSQTQLQFPTSSNSLREVGFQFDKTDGIGASESSFSIQEGTKSRAVDLDLTNGEKLLGFVNSSEVQMKHKSSNKIRKNSVEAGNLVSQRPLSKMEMPQGLKTASKETSPAGEDELVAINESVLGPEKQSTVLLGQSDTETSSPKVSKDARNSKHKRNMKKANSLGLNYEKRLYEPHKIGSISEPSKQTDCILGITMSCGKAPCSTGTKDFSALNSNKKFLDAPKIISMSCNKQKYCVQNKTKLSKKIPCSSEIEVLSVGLNVQDEELDQKQTEFQEQEIAPRETSLPEVTTRSSSHTHEDIFHESSKDAVIIQMIDPADLKSKVDEVLSELVVHEEENNSESLMPDDQEIVSNQHDVQSHGEGEVIISQYEEERGISDETDSRTVHQLISFANNLNERMKEKREPNSKTPADSQLERRITSGDAESESSATHSGSHSLKKIGADNSNPLTCKFCNKKFKNKETLRRHNTNQHKNVKIGGFPCEMCGKVYDKKISWKEHMRRCHNPNPEVSHCEMCGNIFSRPEYLKQHMQCVHSLKTYSCSLCQQACKTKFIYDRHMKRFHKDLDTFKHRCSHCPWATNTLSIYKQHVDRHVKKRDCVEHTTVIIANSMVHCFALVFTSPARFVLKTIEERITVC